MEELQNLRNEIDKLDDQISKLFQERIKVAGKIGKIKGENGINVSHPQREKEIINRVTKSAPDEAKSIIKQLYENIFLLSKIHQSNFINVQSPTADKIRESLCDKKLSLPVSALVACQGVDGAYSGIAAEKLFEISDIMYFKNFEDVFNAVDKGLCEYGVLPIENSTAGSVLEVYDLMEKHNFYIVESIRMQISHVIAIKNTSSIDKVKKVYSHQQALNQCSKYVKNLGAETIALENTAVAAKFVADCDSDDVAVICSERCAEIYGLKIVEKGVQDSKSNFTRFICISKQMQFLSGADKVSVMTSLQNKVGSLNKMLSRFASQGLNLTKLESRPISGLQFEFMFYFDFEGNLENEGIINLMAELENSSEKFVFLGCYKEKI